MVNESRKDPPLPSPPSCIHYTSDKGAELAIPWIQGKTPRWTKLDLAECQQCLIRQV